MTQPALPRRTLLVIVAVVGAGLAFALVSKFGGGHDGPSGLSLDCAAAAVNARGVGKPCQANTDCAGQAAITCLGATEADGAAFCTTYCTGVDDDECGEGARCVRRGDRPSVCSPLACAAGLEVLPPPPVAIDRRCTVGQVNAFGVGKTCESHDDCAEFAVARSCPIVFKPDNPNWCSMLCSTDAECGPAAFCLAEETVERGTSFTVRSCAPVACKLPTAGTATQ